MQVKLLRVLQERQFDRLAENNDLGRHRVITATNRDLEQMVEANQFRQDLYYRLNVVNTGAPPLRERPRRHSDSARFRSSRHFDDADSSRWLPAIGMSSGRSGAEAAPVRRVKR